MPLLFASTPMNNVVPKLLHNGWMCLLALSISLASSSGQAPAPTTAPTSDPVAAAYCTLPHTNPNPGYLDLKENLEWVGTIYDSRFNRLFGNAAQSGRQDHHRKACLNPD